MSYYKVLGLANEPFSTSPDPAFFYEARDHKAALYRLRIALRLKRGLSLILGDVGTGKTTLSRRLYQMLSKEPSCDFHILLNPVFKSEEEFLEKLMESFHIELPQKPISTVHYFDILEKNLFQRGVEEKKTIVLLIDEAQKLSKTSLEILRTLLNYETNEHKILQLVLMSQLELLPKISRLKNLWDRISLKYMLNPLGLEEMTELINFRLLQAGYNAKKPLFASEAMEEIHRHTQGYPRQVTLLCHNVLEKLVMENKEEVTRKIVQEMVLQEERILNASKEQEPVEDGGR
ncbi:MAG: AAA family ATPase [Deltaproteobacteria bacterium]|nr:AAA family ATPase [Deltaproteobacteria bacterium]